MHHSRAPVLKVEVADTGDSRLRGLIGREGLEPNTGMLFVFDKPDIHDFHMLGMQFSIETILLDVSGTVVGILKMPFGATAAFRGKLPHKYALEVPWGWTSDNDVRMGDSFEFRM